MRRILSLSLLAVPLVSYAEPRESPVLVDFSELEQALEPGKTPADPLLTTITEAMAAECGDEGAPQDLITFDGVFADGGGRQKITYAKCGTRPFRATRVFAVTKGTNLLLAGKSWQGDTLRLIEDVDGDGKTEVVLQHSVLSGGVTTVSSVLVGYGAAGEEVLTDFGPVNVSSDPDPTLDACMERAAVIFLKVTDLSKMSRKAYRQPCGAEKEWAEVGDEPVTGQ